MNPDQPSDGGIELAPGVYVTPAAIRFTFSRSSGPGGQNVNKLNTKVELWVAVESLRGMHDDARHRLRTLAGRRLTQLDEIHIASEERRTQEGNRAAALDRLRELLVQAKQRPKRRRATRPTRASVRRRLEAKQIRGEIKRGRSSAED